MAKILLLLSCCAVPAVELKAEATEFKIVALGTSLTARGGWQDDLRRRLGDCIKSPVRISTIAQNGATSAWGLSVLDRISAERPDAVLIEFAINDAAINRFMSVATSRDNIGQIIKYLHGLSSRPKIIIMGMNPVWGARGLLRPFLKNYIDAHRKIANDSGVMFVDHGRAWASLGSAQLHAAIPDGIHPSSHVTSSLINASIVKLLVEGDCSGI